MAAINVLNPVIVNVQRSWTKEATLTLIRYRRRYHHFFEDRTIRDHTDIWARISNRIQILDNFVVSGQQCRTKWQALKRGYENLCQMFDGNPNVGFHTDQIGSRFWRSDLDSTWTRSEGKKYYHDLVV